MTVQKVRSSVEYEALHIIPENYTTARAWLLGAGDNQAELRQVEDLESITDFHLVRHPSGFLGFIHPGDYPTEFEPVGDILDALEAEYATPVPSAEGGELTTVEEWEIKSPESGNWVEVKDVEEAKEMARVTRVSQARSRTKVTVTQAWREVGL